MDISHPDLSHPVVSCQASPDGPSHVFDFALGHEYVFPLGALAFDIGSSAVGLRAKGCEMALVLTWNASVALEFGQTIGMRVNLNHDPLAYVGAGLEMTTNCNYTGSLAVVGMDLEIARDQTYALVELYLGPRFSYVRLVLDATLHGHAKLGFGDAITELFGSDADALTLLPFIEWDDVSFGWNASACIGACNGTGSPNGITVGAPSFSVGDGRVCAGQLIFKLSDNLIKRANAFLEPFEAALGPGGTLVKKIDNTHFVRHFSPFLVCVCLCVVVCVCV